MPVSTFNSYQVLAGRYALYPEAGTSSPLALAYCALGLTGESGEYSEKVKKLLRDGKYNKAEAAKELSDVLWYLTACAKENGFTLQDIAEINLVKLADRAERGMLQGNGDNR